MDVENVKTAILGINKIKQSSNFQELLLNLENRMSILHQTKKLTESLKNELKSLLLAKELIKMLELIDND